MHEKRLGIVFVEMVGDYNDLVRLDPGIAVEIVRNYHRSAIGSIAKGRGR